MRVKSAGDEQQAADDLDEANRHGEDKGRREAELGEGRRGVRQAAAREPEQLLRAMGDENRAGGKAQHRGSERAPFRPRTPSTRSGQGRAAIVPSFGAGNTMGANRGMHHVEPPRVPSRRRRAAALASFADTGLTRVAAAGKQRRRAGAGRRRRGRDLLARDPAGVHARPHDHQSQQRRLLSRARASCTKRSSAISTSRTRRRSTTCGRSSSRTSRACGGGSRPSSDAIPRSWRSRATRARRCRSPSSASISRPGDEVVTTNQDYGRMLDTWEQRVRRDGIKLTKISFPVPPRIAGRARRSADRRDHAGDEGAPLLPHHQPDRTDLPGEADLRRGAAARHQDGRRRRARVRALPVTRRAISAATTTAPACTSGCSRRSGRDSSTCGASTSRGLWPLTPAGARRRRTTSASSRRSARTRPRTTTRLPRR